MRPWEPPLERFKGAMELPRSLLSSPLPSAPSAAPQEGRGDTPHIVRFPITIEARSEKASHNRKSQKGSPGTSPSKHTGGTPSFRTYEDILALDKAEDDEVTPNDVFLHVHTKDHDGVTFIDNRSAQFHAKLVRRREEHTQATPYHLIDKEQLYYDAAGVCPIGRVYGFGLLARKTRRYADPSSSTSQEPMVRRSEFDAVVQRLAQFEAFVQSQLGMCMNFDANTSRTPPPPPP
ncbi:hypothetical protein Scep_011940 [Stephania cephalantha]|uniref:Uncharacterized protein n=1 Tax=Stephania cephalantha TaxID=152367 RepID=A0AAP0P621_9MAGN